MLNTCGAPFLNAQANRPPFSLGYPAMELPRNYHKLLGAAFHLRSSLGATQSSNLTGKTGLEPVTWRLTVARSPNWTTCQQDHYFSRVSSILTPSFWDYSGSYFGLAGWQATVSSNHQNSHLCDRRALRSTAVRLKTVTFSTISCFCFLESGPTAS